MSTIPELQHPLPEHLVQQLADMGIDPTNIKGNMIDDVLSKVNDLPESAWSPASMVVPWEQSERNSRIIVDTEFPVLEPGRGQLQRAVDTLSHVMTYILGPKSQDGELPRLYRGHSGNTVLATLNCVAVIDVAYGQPSVRLILTSSLYAHAEFFFDATNIDWERAKQYVTSEKHRSGRAVNAFHNELTVLADKDLLVKAELLTQTDGTAIYLHQVQPDHTPVVTGILMEMLVRDAPTLAFGEKDNPGTFIAELKMNTGFQNAFPRQFARPNESVMLVIRRVVDGLIETTNRYRDSGVLHHLPRMAAASRMSLGDIWIAVTEMVTEHETREKRLDAIYSVVKDLDVAKEVLQTLVGRGLFSDSPGNLFGHMAVAVNHVGPDTTFTDAVR